jgi:hypothetical protein
VQPDDHSPQNESTPPQVDEVDTRRAGIAEAVQSWGTLVSTVIAAIAVFIAGLGVSLQAEANDKQAEALRDQVEINNLVRDDNQMEYASRISWWIAYSGDGKATVRIQNRSVVPVRSVFMRVRMTVLNVLETDPREATFEWQPWLMLPVIPPCSAFSFSIKDHLPVPQERVIGTIEVSELLFSDVHGKWTVTSGGAPEPAKSKELPTISSAGAVDSLTPETSIGCDG